MINKIILQGNVARVDLRYSQGDTTMAIVKGALAVDRKYQKGKDKETDFINFVAFGKTAEFIEKYFPKGAQMLIVGRLQTDSYTNKEGVKIYTTEVLVEEVEFAGRKSSGSSDDSQKEYPDVPNVANGDGFMNIPDGIDEELPFN